MLFSCYIFTTDTGILSRKKVRRTKTPCASTLHYIFKAIDATALENALTHWAIAVLENLPTATQTHAIAIDGKTLCGSQKQGATLTHLLSVVSHQLGITRRQQPVAAKTNEISIARQILQALDVSGKSVTTDCGNIPQVMAVSLRNTVLTLLCISGYTQIAKALRFFAAQPWKALNIIQKQKLDN